MAAPEGGGDKVAEREVVSRAGSCVVVCLLKRPKTLVAGLAAAAVKPRLGPTRLIQGIFGPVCVCPWWRAGTAEAETEGGAAKVQESCSKEQGCGCVCLSKAR
jgi:hypothetical protein